VEYILSLFSDVEKFTIHISVFALLYLLLVDRQRTGFLFCLLNFLY